MDLHDAFSVERYRHDLARQDQHAVLARRALSLYAVLAAAIAGAAIALLSARESLGLDKAMMPAMLAMLAWLLVFLAAVTILQIATAMVRWRRSGAAATEIDPGTPAPSRVWWLGDAIGILLVKASAVAGWMLLAHLAAVVAGE